MSNLIQPVMLKKTFAFNSSLSKMYLKDYNHAELCDFGLAISTVISISLILEGNGLEMLQIKVFIVQIKEDSEDHFIKKVEIRTVIGMAEKLNKITATFTWSYC